MNTRESAKAVEVPTVPAPSKVTLWVNAPSGLNLREQPALTAKVLSVLPPATQVEASTKTSNSFVEVHVAGERGWAAREFLSEIPVVLYDPEPSYVISPPTDFSFMDPVPSPMGPSFGPYIPYAGNGGGPTLCADGLTSHSSGRGTCSHHGGIY